MHSAKALPSATHGIRHKATKYSAKPSLLSVFYLLRELSVKKKSNRNGQLTVTQLCRAMTAGTRQRLHSLPSAAARALSKESCFAECLGNMLLFAECLACDTRQKVALPSA